jgi:hypothetical protein
MDCEKFDQHVIDALYDELDELTHAALKRHVEGCSRCAGVYAGLRATREVGVLPIEEPPDDLEARILDAVAAAQQHTPWHKKALRGLAWAGSHAMRPQLAMAAIFCLVIGSSLALLRARPGSLSPVSVTEHGAPAPEPVEVAAAAHPLPPADTPVPPPVAAAPAAAEAPAFGGDPGVIGGVSGKSKGGADDARAALAEARALRDSSGCAAAVPKLDAIAVTFSGTQPAADAMWDEATCYKQMGEAQKAQQLYLALRSTGYRDRAEQQLASSEANSAMQNQIAASPAAAAPPPPAPVAARAASKAAKAANNAFDAPAASSPNAAMRPAAGAPNPRAPAAPSPRAASPKAAGFAP